jgi:flagellar assembly factor FliW
MANITVATRFGELEVNPSQVIVFPHGVPGFEQSSRWMLFHEIDEQGNWANGMVVYLQSVDDGDVALPLTDPALFGFNYELALSDDEVAELELEEPGDVMVLTTLSIKASAANSGGRPAISDMYVNIAAPILINTKSRIGLQKILAGNEAGAGPGSKQSA